MNSIKKGHERNAGNYNKRVGIEQNTKHLLWQGGKIKTRIFAMEMVISRCKSRIKIWTSFVGFILVNHDKEQYV